MGDNQLAQRRSAVAHHMGIVSEAERIDPPAALARMADIEYARFTSPGQIFLDYQRFASWKLREIGGKLLAVLNQTHTIAAGSDVRLDDHRIGKCGLGHPCLDRMGMCERRLSVGNCQ